MAYFCNNNDANLFYSNSSGFGEFDAYPSLDQTTAAGEENARALETFAHDWGMGVQPSHVASSSRNLLPETSFEYASPVTSYAPLAQDCGQLSLPENYWQGTATYGQSYGSGVVSRDNSFALASDVSTVVPAPSGELFDYWGNNQTGPSTSTSCTNVQTLHQPSSCLTRTGQTPTWRFQPYGVPHAWLDQYGNAEAGPSSLVPPSTLYVAPSTTYPSGGLPEASADAEKNQTTTEDDAAPTTRRPGRVRYQQYVRRLCIWAQGWKDLEKRPSHVKALRTALAAIERFRAPVYDTPRLTRGTGVRTTQGKKAPDTEHRRRENTRELNEELSRYYQLATNQEAWGCPELVLKVLDDVEGLL